MQPNIFYILYFVRLEKLYRHECQGDCAEEKDLETADINNGGYKSMKLVLIIEKIFLRNMKESTKLENECLFVGAM